MKLVYKPKAGFDAPPSGWPASDHEESDPALVKAKLASGFYVEEKKNAKKEVKS